MEARLLVVEDEKAVADFLVDELRKARFQVVVARDGEQALALAQTEKPDLILLDVLLPKRDGWEVCRELRKWPSYVPIIMLTVLDEDIDEVKGLAIGADHYLKKPTNGRLEIRLLVAQIEATLRTVQESRRPQPRARLVFEGLMIDLNAHRVWVAGREVGLSRMEFDLLRFLAQKPGQVFGRETLLDKVWDVTVAIDSRVVDKTIADVRKKIEPNPSLPSFIETVRGIGYRFGAEPKEG
jgi:two-component system response regulator VicR